MRIIRIKNGPESAPPTDPFEGQRSSFEPAAQYLLLIDLLQGITTGAALYLLSLTLLKTLTPPSMFPMILLALGWCVWGSYRLQWREGAVALGVGIGMAANLLAPVLLFFLFLVGWTRPQRSLTTPWAAFGLGLLGAGLTLIQPTLASLLEAPQRTVLTMAYIAPVAIGAVSACTMSNYAVAVARTTSIEVSLLHLHSSWLTLGGLVLALAALAGLIAGR